MLGICRKTDRQNDDDDDDDDCCKPRDYFVISIAKRKTSDRKADSFKVFRLICRKRIDSLTNMSRAFMGFYRSHT